MTPGVFCRVTPPKTITVPPAKVFGVVPPRMVVPGKPVSIKVPGPDSAPLRVRKPVCASVRFALSLPSPLRV